MKKHCISQKLQRKTLLFVFLRQLNPHKNIVFYELRYMYGS